MAREGGTPSVADRFLSLMSYRSLAGRLIALGMTFAVGALLLQLSGISPTYAYYVMFTQSLSTSFGIRLVLVKMAPLLCVALALLVAFKAGLWNIGALGQVLIGALFASQIGINLDLPTVFVVPLELIAGMVGGMAWAFVPALLRARFEVNEVVTTLLMNFIAMFLTVALVKGPLSDPIMYGVQTYTILESARLPIMPLFGAHVGIVIVLILAAGVHVLLSRTKLGYQVIIFGANPRAAKYAGIRTERFVMTTFLMSGAIAGVAGMIELTGMTYRLQAGWVPGYGFDGVPLVFLAGLNTLAIIPASFLFAVFLAGGQLMYAETGVPVYFVRALEGFILFFFAIAEVFTFRRKQITTSLGGG